MSFMKKTGGRIRTEEYHAQLRLLIPLECYMSKTSYHNLTSYRLTTACSCKEFRALNHTQKGLLT